jgi:DNA-binding GntR family transcriptional regulator
MQSITSVCQEFLCYALAVPTQDSATSRVSTTVIRVRKAIFGGQLPPGAPIRELTLARDFGVSQATVREALQRLEHMGLVTRQRKVGTTVTRLAPKDVRERVALRSTLETMAAQSAAERMNDSDFEELERRLSLLGEAIKSDSYYEAAHADLEFHRYIWRCSGNDMLCQLLELVTVPLFAFISILRSQGLQKLTAVVAEHSPLVEALRSRDPQRIQAAFERGAVSFYEPFQGEGSERAMAGAFGYLEVSR